jgi:phytanoyl-CoA hydroxylase
MTRCRLGQEQIDHYWEHGYVVIPELIDAERIDLWRRRFDYIVEHPSERPDKMLVMRDVMVVKGVVEPEKMMECVAKVQDFEDEPVLSAYINDPDILDSAESLIGEGLISIHTMLINKPPNVDGRHPLHQDLLYFPFRPADKILASWTALDPCTKENGCLVAVPGTHRSELLQHENPAWEHLNIGYFGAKGIGADEHRVHLEMESGDTVFFHPLLLHGSGRNRTQGVRRSISAHYASASCAENWQDERFGGRHYRRVIRQGE